MRKKNLVILIYFISSISIMNACQKKEEFFRKSIIQCTNYVSKEFPSIKNIYISVYTDYTLSNINEFINKAKKENLSEANMMNYIKFEVTNEEITRYKVKCEKIGSINLKPFVKSNTKNLKKYKKKENCVWLSRSNIFINNTERYILYGVYDTVLYLDKDNNIIDHVFHVSGYFPKYFLLYSCIKKNRSDQIIRIDY